MEKKLEEFYRDNVPQKEICLYFNKKPSAISSKAIELGLTKKYMRKNNPNYKAPYQDYDWCYQNYIVQGKSLQAMADELHCQKRVVQKWCTDTFGLHRRSAAQYLTLNPIQYQIIVAGTLGDGHISPRDLCYIESHSVDEKEYLFWKYEKLKNLCASAPTWYPEKQMTHFGGSYLCKPYYRYETRKINSLQSILEMSRSDRITKMSALGIGLYFLDDGSRTHSNWELCVAMLSAIDKSWLLEKLSRQYGIHGHILKDERYVLFDSVSSNRVDDLILEFLPSNIDVVQKKIMKYRGAA